MQLVCEAHRLPLELEESYMDYILEPRGERPTYVGHFVCEGGCRHTKTKEACHAAAA